MSQVLACIVSITYGILVLGLLTQQPFCTGSTAHHYLVHSYNLGSSRKHDVNMSDRSPTSRISTHYYKIGHLLLVSYEVFSSKDASLDQYLLELELQIRNDYPRILLTYYNKSLYQFKFEHILSEHSTDGQYLFPHARLDELYPQLEFRSQSSIPACFLSKPTKSAATQTNTKRENQPHLLSLIHI